MVVRTVCPMMWARNPGANRSIYVMIAAVASRGVAVGDVRVVHSGWMLSTDRLARRDTADR